MVRPSVAFEERIREGVGGGGGWGLVDFGLVNQAADFGIQRHEY